MSYSESNISLTRANTNSYAFDSGDITENTVDAYANLFYPCILDNGGNTQNIALTIDILNKEELENETKNFVNKNWVNKNRLDNNVSTSKAIWGFKEAFHGVKKSRAISNAFCFTGQQITFYIAPQGHFTGYVDDQWVYSKTTISISAIDIINGTNTVLKTFNGFENSSDDTTRYFSWTVPSPDNNTFANYGMFGLVVLKIEVSQDYYEDAQWTVPLEDSVPYLNQSHLQLLIYSGAREIIDVTNVGDLNIVTDTILSTETLEQIFDNTIFDSLQSLNQNPLTIANKRAIIADQIATLFISQHPVITADFCPGKVIGVGGSAAVPPRKVLEKAIIYSKRYPEIVPLVIDRLFGMVATYKAFNFCVDIEKYISDYTQSTQVIRDPVRVIYMSEDGDVEGDLGIDGLIFDPYALSVLNTETILDSPDAASIDITLQDGTVDIQNIQILDAGGVLPVQPHSKSVMVSFDVVYGASNIKYIRYSILSKEGLNYSAYTDNTGLSRYHVFNLDNEVIPEPSKRGDVVSCQIDIEDFDGLVTSFIYSIGLHGYAVKPTLRDLKIRQRKDGSDIVDIFYTYDGLGEINNSYVYLQFSSDGGVTWSTVKTTSLKGDVGSNIQPGRRQITWKPLVDLSNYSDRIFARISLYDSENNLAEGDTLTGELVKSLLSPEIAVMRHAEELQSVTRTALFANETYIVPSFDYDICFAYSGKPSTTATVIIDGVSFIIGNISGYFVWDIGGTNHVFTYEGSSTSFILNGDAYTVVYNGTGSFLFTLYVSLISSSSSSSSSSYIENWSSSSNSSSSSSSNSSSSNSSNSSSSNSSNSSSSNSSSSNSSSSDSSSSISSSSSSNSSSSNSSSSNSSSSNSSSTSSSSTEIRSSSSSSNSSSSNSSSSNSDSSSSSSTAIRSSSSSSSSSEEVLGVAGSISPNATGNYYYDGEYNGQRSWRRNDGSYYIWYVFEIGFHYWNISIAKGDYSAGEWYTETASIIDVTASSYAPYTYTGTATVTRM